MQVLSMSTRKGRKIIHNSHQVEGAKRVLSVPHLHHWHQQFHDGRQEGVSASLGHLKQDWTQDKLGPGQTHPDIARRLLIQAGQHHCVEGQAGCSGHHL